VPGDSGRPETAEPPANWAITRRSSARHSRPAHEDPALDVPDLPDRIAAVLDWVWTEAVEPDWQRRQRAFEADIIARTRRLSTSGWASALDDI
jgi:hypothetical protein